MKKMQEQYVLLKENEEDEETKNQTLIEDQESAGFYEPNDRINIGGLFNHLLFFSTLNGSPTQSEPSGQLKEAIEKSFTDYNGLKEAFKKVVSSRF